MRTLTLNVLLDISFQPCNVFQLVVKDNFTNIFQCSIREDGAEGDPPSIKYGADGVPTSENTCIIEQDQSHLDPIEQVFVEESNLKTELLDDYPEESQYQRTYNENPNDLEETNIYPEDINTSFEETSAFVSLELLPSKKPKKAKKKRVQDIPAEEEQTPQKKKKKNIEKKRRLLGYL